MKKKELSYSRWFIPGNTPSLKNSKIKTSRGIFPSKTVTKYLRDLGILSYSSSRKEIKEYKTKPNLFKKSLIGFPQLKSEDYPIKLGFYFIRKTKADFDFNNISQVILDLMTAHNFIEDDCMRYILPFPIEIEGKYFHVDKDNCGVIIKILE